MVDGVLPFSVDLYRPDLEVDADGGDVIAGEGVVSEPGRDIDYNHKQNGWLNDCAF